MRHDRIGEVDRVGEVPTGLHNTGAEESVAVQVVVDVVGTDVADIADEVARAVRVLSD